MRRHLQRCHAGPAAIMSPAPLIEQVATCLRSKPFHSDRRSTSTTYFSSATGPSHDLSLRARSARSFARVRSLNIVKSMGLALIDDDVR